MPATSKAQQRFFGMLKGNPAMAKAKGIDAQTVDEFASTKQKGLPERAPKKPRRPSLAERAKARKV